MAVRIKEKKEKAMQSWRLEHAWEEKKGVRASLAHLRHQREGLCSYPAVSNGERGMK